MLLMATAMRLDEIQAMLCAVVSSPVPIAPAVWLPEALGKGFANISDPEVSETIELLMRLNNDLATALLEDETIAPSFIRSMKAARSTTMPPGPTPTFSAQGWAMTGSSRRASTPMSFPNC
jgi:yecA family protein